MRKASEKKKAQRPEEGLIDLSRSKSVSTIGGVMKNLEDEANLLKAGKLTAENARILLGFRKLQIKSVDTTLTAGRLQLQAQKFYGKVGGVVRGLLV